MRQVVVAAERIERWLAGFAERHGQVTVAASADELALQGADGATARLTVPFPPLDPPLPPAPSLQDATTALASHANRDRRVAVLLVRRAGHAVGLFEGTRLVASKVDSTYVQGTTKAGGWSQQRYARRRGNQAQAAFADAADTAARLLLPYAGGIDAFVCGGDRGAVDAVLADPRLEPLVARRTGRLLDVPDPKLRVLQASPEQFRAVRIALEP